MNLNRNFSILMNFQLFFTCNLNYQFFIVDLGVCISQFKAPSSMGNNGKGKFRRDIWCWITRAIDSFDISIYIYNSYV